MIVFDWFDPSSAHTTNRPLTCSDAESGAFVVGARAIYGR